MLISPVRNRSKRIHALKCTGQVSFGFTPPYSRSKSYCFVPATPLAYSMLETWCADNNELFEPEQSVVEFIDYETQLRSKVAYDFNSTTFNFNYFNFDKLYEHQKHGIGFLISQYKHYGAIRALIADDPRVGKSAQALAALKCIGEGPILILCPKSLIHQWADYVKTWHGGDVHLLTGPNKRRYKQLKAALAKPAPVIITNWHTLHMAAKVEMIANRKKVKVVWPEFFKTKWFGLIGDEAHCLKNKGSGMSRIMKTFAPCAKHVFLLSATFIEKGAENIYSPLNIILPKQYSNHGYFAGMYSKAIKTQWGITYTGVRNAEIFKDALSPVVLQRKVEDLTDIGDKIYRTYTCELDELHREFYNRVVTEVLLELEDETLPIFSQIARMIRLRQVAISPAIIESHWETPTVKFEVLKDIVDGIPANQQVIVYCSYVKGCELAQEFVGGGKIFAGEHAKQSVVDSFKTGKFRILYMTTQRGVGLNLYNADTIIYLDLPWSSILLRQSEERTRAVGKLTPVGVYNIIAKNTIDTTISNTLRSKQQTITKTDVLKTVLGYLNGLPKNS